MLPSVLLLTASVCVCAHARSIDQVIRDAYKGEIKSPNNESVLVGMDMIFTRQQWDEMTNSVDPQKAIKGDKYRWTSNTLVYYIDTPFLPNERAVIVRAMEEWSKYTCVKFRTYRAGDTNYVMIVDGNGCNSNVGMIGGVQYLTLSRTGCIQHATVVHELGHAIGFQHEHQRPDRDDYITVQLDSVGTDWKFAFNKLSWTHVDNRNIAYDYTSVMHYGLTAFSVDSRSVSIVTHDSRYQRVIGIAPGLSYSDIMLANDIYKCAARCSTQPCPYGGFRRGEDCQCMCSSGDPRSPLCDCSSEECAGSYMDCIDQNTLCAYWVRAGECRANPYYMLFYCPKACGVCGQDAMCMDYPVSCAEWASDGDCNANRYREFMRIFCPKVCNFC